MIEMDEIYTETKEKRNVESPKKIKEVACT